MVPHCASDQGNPISKAAVLSRSANYIVDLTVYIEQLKVGEYGCLRQALLRRGAVTIAETVLLSPRTAIKDRDDRLTALLDIAEKRECKHDTVQLPSTCSDPVVRLLAAQLQLHRVTETRTRSTKNRWCPPLHPRAETGNRSIATSSAPPTARAQSSECPRRLAV